MDLIIPSKINFCSFPTIVLIFLTISSTTFITLAEAEAVETVVEEKFLNENEDEDFTTGFLYKCSKKVGHFQIPGFFNVNLQLTEVRRPICSNSSSSLNGELFSLKIQRFEDSKKNYFFPFTPEGYLVHKGGDKEIYFHRENFCISRLSSQGHIFVQACRSQCFIHERERGANLCIPKCCRYGELMTSIGCHSPLEAGQLMSPHIFVDLDMSHSASHHDDHNPESKIQPQFLVNDFGVQWNCSSSTETRNFLVPQRIPAERIRILQDGRIFQKIDPGPVPASGFEEWRILNPGQNDEFCIDAFLNVSNEFGDQNFESSTAVDYFVLSCSSSGGHFGPNPTTESAHTYPKIVFGITLLTCFIHLVIVTVYLVLWNYQNVHGWTAFVLCSTQFFLNLFLCGLFGIFAFGQPEKVLTNGLQVICFGIGILHHFLLICTFSWSTVFSFDAWSKIRSMTPRSTNSKGKKRFRLYCIVGFGAPTIVMIVAASIEFSRDTSVIRPGYGKSCIIDEALAYMFYIIVVIFALFLANCFFALHTLRTLWEARKEAQILTNSSKSSSKHETRVILVVKLFILMGIFLGFEVTLAFISPYKVSIYLSFLDFYRIFHALGLFWIFVWNKKTGDQLSQKFPKFKNILWRRLRRGQLHHDVVASKETIAKSVSK